MKNYYTDNKKAFVGIISGIVIIMAGTMIEYDHVIKTILIGIAFWIMLMWLVFKH